MQEPTNIKQFKLAFTFGRFNLLHRGHIDLFKNMANCSDRILIGVSTGPKNLNYANRRKVIRQALSEDPDFTSDYEIISSRSPFGVLDSVDEDAHNTVIYLGQDQFELGQTLTKGFGCSSVCIPRLTSSSTIRYLIDTEQWSLLAREVPQTIINEVIFLRQQELNA